MSFGLAHSKSDLLTTLSLKPNHLVGIHAHFPAHHRPRLCWAVIERWRRKVAVHVEPERQRRPQAGLGALGRPLQCKTIYDGNREPCRGSFMPRIPRHEIMIHAVRPSPKYQTRGNRIRRVSQAVSHQVPSVFKSPHHKPSLPTLVPTPQTDVLSMNGDGRPSPPVVISRPEYINLVARYYVETTRQVTRIKNDALAAAEMAGFCELGTQGERKLGDAHRVCIYSRGHVRLYPVIRRTASQCPNGDGSILESA